MSKKLPIVLNLPPMPNPGDFMIVDDEAYKAALAAWERAMKGVARVVKGGQHGAYGWERTERPAARSVKKKKQ